MVDNCLLRSLFQSTYWSQHRIASTRYLGDSKVERRCHHGVLMVDYCPLRLPCSQHAESSMGREAGGRILIILSLVFVVLFPLTLHGSVVRCQSTSSHGACRRLTVDQPNFRPTIDVHHTITCPFSMKLAILCTPVEYLKAFVHLQTGRQLSLGMERPTPIKDAAVHRLAQSIAQMTLCQVTTTEIDDATKLLEKARDRNSKESKTSHPRG